MFGRIAVLIALTLLLTACPEKGEIMWKDSYWLLTSIRDQELKTGPEHRPVYIHLPDGPNGKVEGFAGCNRFFGTCTLDEDQLQFSRMASTKMMCPDIETERALLKALEETEMYRVKGKTLQLLAGGEVLASFVPSEEKP